MRAGDMDQRVQLQEFTGEVQDSFGDTTASRLVDANWTTRSTRWAEVTSLQGRELFQAGQEGAKVTHRIRIRYHSTVTPRWRVVWGSKKLEIKSATDPSGDRRETIIYAEEWLP